MLTKYKANDIIQIRKITENKEDNIKNNTKRGDSSE